jgi:hypothetical protein
LIRRYRSPIPLASTLFASVGFFLLGISSLAFAPRGDAGDRVMGALLVVFAFIAGAIAVTTEVVLSPTGIAYRDNFKRKEIGWDTVRSLRVMPMRSGIWSNMMVDLSPSGKARIACVIGPQRYVRRLIAEFEAYREELASADGPTTPTSPRK